MSLITRCPACGTMFKVVPDQLRVSDGWVRCGHCTDVFDATANMHEGAKPEDPQPQDLQPQDLQPEAVAPSPELPLAQPAPARLASWDVAANEPEDAEPASGFASSAIHTELPEGAADEAPDSEQLLEHEHSLREDVRDQPFELRRPDREDEIVDAPLVNQPAPIEREPELHEISFVRQARRNEFWSASSVRAVLGLLLVVLATLLVVQYAIHHRDRLAASDPSLRPWLMGLCEPFGCTVGPPRQIEAIAIDNTTFNKLEGDTYRLSVTVKNQAATPSAVPALELTLTDAQDQPVIRRVLLPAEIAAGTSVIAPGADWSTSVALAVAAEGFNSRIAGYRVIAFYP